MSSILFRAGLLLCGVALLLVCSCEKHRVGEYPEVQVDRLYGEKHHPDAPPTNAATPVKFFPENKSPGKSP